MVNIRSACILEALLVGRAMDSPARRRDRQSRAHIAFIIFHFLHKHELADGGVTGSGAGRV